MENREPILMDKTAYDLLINELEQKRQLLSGLLVQRNDSYHAGAGKGRENPEFTCLEDETLLITADIRRLKDVMRRAIIVKKQDNENLIDIGDTVDLIFSINGVADDEIETFKLVGGLADALAGEISINSPLGSSIYKKEVGTICGYQVGNKKIEVKIISKQNTSQSNSVVEK